MDAPEDDPASPTVTVLESVAEPGDRTNPYLRQLEASLPPWVRVRYFSWPVALAGRFDVFHLHWPEVRLRGSTRPRTAWRCLLVLLLLVRLRVTRRALVRTLHNLAPHEPLPWPARAVSRLCDRWTTLWITLTDLTSPPVPGPVVVAPLGHVRDWFADLPRREPVPGRLVHVGLVRRYKGIDALLRAFTALPGDRLSLRVVGAADEEGLASDIHRACARDPRITFVDDYVADEALVGELTAGELVVLPFAAVTNSSSLVLALSLDRPVLVPSMPLTEQLAAEVGPGWVLTYDGPLEPVTLERALATVRSRGEVARPDLSGREWPAIGALHAAAFTRAVAARRGA